MKRIFCLFLSIIFLCTFAACRRSDDNTDNNSESNSAGDRETQPEPSVTEEENDIMKIEIVIGEEIFTATLNDGDAARALRAQLPMTLDMSELNGNEKYYYLSDSLPTDSYKPSGINAGDLMLYGNNCLVLFYESFSTNYSYTPLGHVDKPDELAKALGKGSVRVTFR